MLSIPKPSRLAAFETMVQSNLKTKILGYMTNQHLQPSYAEYLQLNEALQAGDEPMDQVMRWVLQNPKLHRKYFETALYEGLDKLPHDVPELTQFFSLVERKPTWYDQVKIDKALQFTYRLGANNGLILRDLSLMAGYMYPGFNQPLILTGALKNKQLRALQKPQNGGLISQRKRALNVITRAFVPQFMFVSFIL
jgi:hypothetical protein